MTLLVLLVQTIVDATCIIITPLFTKKSFANRSAVKGED